MGYRTCYTVDSGRWDGAAGKSWFQAAIAPPVEQLRIYLYSVALYVSNRKVLNEIATPLSQLSWCDRPLSRAVKPYDSTLGISPGHPVVS